MMEFHNVTIVGAGTMGHSLAQIFAQHGCSVWLTDIRDEALAQARKRIAANLQTLIETGLLDEGDQPQTLRRIQTTTRIEDALSQADLVIEAISEDEKAKKELFQTLDAICPPKTILASNTSYLNIFEFIETRRPDKILITHWFAPPHIVPLVEIVRGPETSQETVDRVGALLIDAGKTPLVISKFLPGFIANRLQSALTHEVLHLIDHGYATPEDIDTATKAGFGLRIPILGLLKRMDYAGLDLVQKIVSNAKYVPPAPRIRSKTVDQLVSQGKLGIKTGSGYYEYGNRSTEELMKERDMKLIRLREFLEKMGEL